ncbi:hypothetical protein ABZX85_38165 [Streptomyces sp. NPDC004539]|uniref:hypothetical protein n=1 Tax=Streptomyces sp. NPDC004539 TaxID=3154280 RepID=UPI0033A90E7E
MAAGNHLGDHLMVLLPCLFGVGATMMFAVPTIQVRLTAFAPDAPTLMGTLDLAALDLANCLGALGGAGISPPSGPALSSLPETVAWVDLAEARSAGV